MRVMGQSFYKFPFYNFFPIVIDWVKKRPDESINKNIEGQTKKPHRGDIKVKKQKTTISSKGGLFKGVSITQNAVNFHIKKLSQSSIIIWSNGF
jgi:uncharacterized protein YdaU (DUF1376 family)